MPQMLHKRLLFPVFPTNITQHFAFGKFNGTKLRDPRAQSKHLQLRSVSLGPPSCLHFSLVRETRLMRPR
jgi:hypothetical protein